MVFLFQVLLICGLFLHFFIGLLVKSVDVKVKFSFVYLGLELFQVAVFAGGVDTSATDTKGTVLIHNAEQVNIEKHLFSMLFDSFLYNIVGRMYVYLM